MSCGRIVHDQRQQYVNSRSVDENIAVQSYPRVGGNLTPIFSAKSVGYVGVDLHHRLTSCTCVHLQQ